MRERWAGWVVAGGVTVLVLAAAGAILLLSGGAAPHHPGVASTSSVTVSQSTTATSSPAAGTTTSTTPSGPPLAQPPARPAPAGDAVGASVNLLFNNPGLTAQQIASQLATLHAAGATVARSDAFWEASEPVAPANGVHHFVWAFDDRVAGALASQHLRWLPILDYTAPWATSIPGVDHSAPVSDADYATYASAFAARYGPGGSFWRAHPELTAEPVRTYEIWNEPDGGFWLPGPQPIQYSDLYLAARAAIDAVQPRSRVIVGGLINAAAFLPQMLAGRPQLRGHVDGIAIHPYGSPLIVLRKIRDARAALDALGLRTVPLYVTEFGWSTSPPGVKDYAPPAQRPGYITEALAALGHLDCGVVATVLYTWFSPRQNPGDGEQWYGIDSLSGSPTPDTQAFAAGARRAGARAATLRLCR